MFDTLDAADGAIVQQWITLLDIVTCMQGAPHAYQVRGNRSITQALDILVAYEDSMPRFLRLVAREIRWQRDFPATPLPPGRDWWQDCQCRRCLVVRRHTPPDRRAIVYEVQLAAVRRQRSS